MPQHPFLRPPLRNRILAALPREESERLRPRQVSVNLAKGRVLHHAGDPVRHLYFPTGGMVSLISTGRDGASVEVGMIGDEGVVGVASLLGSATAPLTALVQIPGGAVRIRAEAVREGFERGGRLRDLTLRYTHTLLTQITQSAVCNRFHTVEERLCRWLLISRDRAPGDTLHLTQEFLSYMLGVPRTSVTAVAGRLQRAGLITYSRGRIHILDRRGLEAVSCECYAIIMEDISHFRAA